MLVAAPTIGYLAYGPPTTSAAREEWPIGLLEALGRHAPTIEPDPPAGCWLAPRAGRPASPPPPPGPALLARGEDDRPLVPLRPPFVLAARRELDFALDDRAQLAALVGDLLAPLLAQLRHRGLGATLATLTLWAVGAQVREIGAPLAAATTE